MSNNNDNRAGETLEGNKLIAEFMGLPLGSAKGRELFGSDRVKKAVYIGLRKSGVVGYSDAYWISWVNPIQCQYHSSWDWLMPVLEKLPYKYDYCAIDEILDKIIERLKIALYDADIQATWQAVVDFIRWHKQQSAPTNKEQPWQTPAP